MTGPFLLLLSTLTHAGNFQDWWWDPQQSGMGFNVGHQGNTVVVAWYNYGEDGKASYLTMAGPLNGSVLKAGLNRGTGPAPGPGYSASQVKQTLVGEATITFESDMKAKFSYSFDGKSGAIELERFTYSPVNITGNWNVATKSIFKGCDYPGFVKEEISFGSLRITQRSPNAYLVTTDSCRISFSASQSGSQVQGVGTMQCVDGPESTVAISKMIVSADTMRMNIVVTEPPAFRCVQEAVLTGVK